MIHDLAHSSLPEDGTLSGHQEAKARLKPCYRKQINIKEKGAVLQYGSPVCYVGKFGRITGLCGEEYLQPQEDGDHISTQQTLSGHMIGFRPWVITPVMVDMEEISTWRPCPGKIPKGRCCGLGREPGRGSVPGATCEAWQPRAVPSGCSITEDRAHPLPGRG